MATWFSRLRINENIQLLTQIAQTSFPRLVVDLGSGTGLSTRYWADKAEQVIGIEPSEDMRRQAEARTAVPNISYLHGFSYATGLGNTCAQIVTCSQALHWMEPQPTNEEVRRILHPGGVFAAFDCFRFTREIVLHHLDLGNAERFVGIAMSQGGIQRLLKSGYTEAEIGVGRLRQISETVLGSLQNLWLWSLRLRIGIT